MIEMLQSMGTGLLIGLAYGFIGSMTALAIESWSGKGRLTAKPFYAIALFWPIAMTAFVIFSARDLVTEVLPILRGPTKHERALAEIERLEAEELAAMEAWERKRNQTREPSLSRWEQEAEDDR